MALVDGDIVALRDSQIVGYEAQDGEFRLLEHTVGSAYAEEEVYHVVARAVVGVDLDLGAHLVDGDILLNYLLQQLGE